MIRQSCPLGKERDACVGSVVGACGIISSCAIGKCIPTGEGITGLDQSSAVRGQNKSYIMSLGLVSRFCSAGASVGVIGDGVGIRRPLGIEGDVRREGVDRAVGVSGSATIGSRVPAGEGVTDHA